MRNQRCCTVRGKDFRGYPVIVKVDAYSAIEAAARGLEAILKERGEISELTITEHTPGREFKINPTQLLKYTSRRLGTDNLGLWDTKRQSLRTNTLVT